MERSKLFDFASFAALKSARPKLQTRSSTLSDPNATESGEAPTSLCLGRRNQGLPTEIFERIVDFLHADKPALISCSTVSRSWFPTSRYHLYNLLPVIPISLGERCCKVNTAVALSVDSILYGTNNGIYLLRNRSLFPVAKVPAVSQIDVLEAQDMFFILSGRRLLMVPLRFATGPLNPVLFHRRLSVLASDVSFFRVGAHAGRPVICIVHTGRFSSHFELMEAFRGDQFDEYRLQLFRSFYLPDRARSVHIGNKMIGAALRTGFQCIDPLSLITFPVPVAPAPPVVDDKKCRAMFRVEDRFLLCYDRCAFFMDKAGVSYESAFAVRWEDHAKQFALTPPYLLTFTPARLRAWRIDSGIHVQTVYGEGIRLLATMPRILVKMGDGRVVALRCAESEKAATTV
ncbi:CNH domain-containing protein [Mycena maculata]|uniref:CNH domain-containing protein n=1 Tax=Mycena maculata TaxID=230809 RepID=A0AAD7KAR4_9AGAR|nr:CNH domain-containing protein [Mycena maculata]